MYGFYGYVWFSMVMYDYQWLCMVIYGYVWLCMVTYDYQWLCMVTYGYVWLIHFPTYLIGRESIKSQIIQERLEAAPQNCGVP